MSALNTLLLFILTALAEIIGCYLPYLYLRQDKSVWLLLPAASCLVLFVWLLTLHPEFAGKTYAAYGGIYIAVALLWLLFVQGIKPDRWDIIGASLSILGAVVILFARRNIL